MIAQAHKKIDILGKQQLGIESADFVEQLTPANQHSDANVKGRFGAGTDIRFDCAGLHSVEHDRVPADSHQ